MDMERAAKIQALQESGTFEQELAMVNTPEEMQTLFGNYGIELTLDEVREMVAQAVKLNGELNEQDLEDVAGGIAWAALAGKVGMWALKVVGSWAVGKVLNKITGW